MEHYVKVDFHHFNAFKRFTLHLRDFNILVGPNNAGKSTVLAAFRILAAANRKATSKKPEIVSGIDGAGYGYVVDLSNISVASENIYYNYDDSKSAKVVFTLSNRNEIVLYFPEQGSCRMAAISHQGNTPRTPTEFKKHFFAPIGFVPILGPVDHEEILYEKEAARLALFNYRASRNFRNIWYHYRDRFQEFREILMRTWPGMDIEPPSVELSDRKPRLHMFCPEDRIPREIFWAGFGFQVWCQMLTNLIQSKDNSIFLIDEPDIYLHSDLQRQLLYILRSLGPNILITTHSTEIISEAESDEILVIDKKKSVARRVKNPSQLSSVFSNLGSNLNPILTQLAKTRRAIFVEGKDFQIIGKFASKMGFSEVGNRSGFAVIPVEGFNPERAKNIKAGMELTLGTGIMTAVIFDRDYRSDRECESIKQACLDFCDLAIVHTYKEIENFLLVPDAIDRAAEARLAENHRRGGENIPYNLLAREILYEFSEERKAYIAAQYMAMRKNFTRQENFGVSDATINELALVEFERDWANQEERLRLIPGKEAFAYVNRKIQESMRISITPTLVVERMHDDEIPVRMRELITALAEFSSS